MSNDFRSSKRTSALVSILIAIVGVVGSVAVALINRQDVQSNITQRFKNLGPVQIESGNALGTITMSVWTLNRAYNSRDPRFLVPRFFVQPIRFSHEFPSPPTVYLSTVEIDAVKGTHLNYIVFAGNVTTTGFDLQYQAFGDSEVNTLNVLWLAYEQL